MSLEIERGWFLGQFDDRAIFAESKLAFSRVLILRIAVL